MMQQPSALFSLVCMIVLSDADIHNQPLIKLYDLQETLFLPDHKHKNIIITSSHNPDYGLY